VNIADETPASLRLKADDLLEIAEQVKVPRISAELKLLALYYLDRAGDLEREEAQSGERRSAQGRT
jgi:hypothetical protein